MPPKASETPIVSTPASTPTGTIRSKYASINNSSTPTSSSFPSLALSSDALDKHLRDLAKADKKARALEKKASSSSLMERFKVGRRRVSDIGTGDTNAKDEGNQALMGGGQAGRRTASVSATTGFGAMVSTAGSSRSGVPSDAAFLPGSLCLSTSGRSSNSSLTKVLSNSSNKSAASGASMASKTSTASIGRAALPGSPALSASNINIPATQPRTPTALLPISENPLQSPLAAPQITPRREEFGISQDFQESFKRNITSLDATVDDAIAKLLILDFSGLEGRGGTPVYEEGGDVESENVNDVLKDMRAFFIAESMHERVATLDYISALTWQLENMLNAPVRTWEDFARQDAPEEADRNGVQGRDVWARNPASSERNHTDAQAGIRDDSYFVSNKL